MLKEHINNVLLASRADGWIMEPRVKDLLRLAGLDVPKFEWVKSVAEALDFTEKIGYPVVLKIVSPKIIHKSDVDGVVVGIDNDEKLEETF